MISRAAVMLLMCVLTATTAWADNVPVSYGTTSWTSGNTYYVTSDVTISDPVTVTGAVTLNLGSGVTLDVESGITVNNGGMLTVTGQGTLNIQGKDGENYSFDGIETIEPTGGETGFCGNLTVKGGTVTVTGGKGGDIGSQYTTGANGGKGIDGSLTVDDGTVTVTGGMGGAGYTSGSGGDGIASNLTVNDGTVTINGGNSGDVGDGACGVPGYGVRGNVSINGGIVQINGGLANPTYADYYTSAVHGSISFTINMKAEAKDDVEKDYYPLTGNSSRAPFLFFHFKEGPTFTYINDGSSGNPYRITSSNDLKDLAIYVNGTGTYSNGQTENTPHDCLDVYFKQTVDITMSATWDSPIGNNSHPFKGHYNGDNKTISNLTVTTNGQYAGLFGYIEGQYKGTEANSKIAEVHGVVLQNPTITATSSEQYAGAVVAYAGNCGRVYDNTVSGGTVSYTGASNYNTNNSYAGGVVGNYANSNLRQLSGNKVVGTTVSGGGICGGLAGCIYYLSGMDGNVVVANVSSAQYISRGQSGTAYGYRQGAVVGEYVINNGLLASVNYYHSANGLTAYGNNYSLSPVSDNASVARIYTLTLPTGVTATGTPVLTYAGKGYYTSGSSVTLSDLPAAEAGYLDWQYTVGGVAIDGTSFTIGEADATVALTHQPNPDDFSVSGSEYTIHTATGWGVFCDALQDNDTYNRFSGKTVKLGADITVSRMAGSDHHDFCGTFDGGGHTLTFNYGTSGSYASDEYAAPFHYVSNVGSTAAAFRNLHVAGHIYTSAKYAAGLIAQHWGTVNVENCRVSTVIHSSVSGDGTHGGFEAECKGVLNITGCVFDGKLLTTNGTDNCGGFVGWHYGGTTNISNSLYAPAAIATGEREAGPGTAGQDPSATFGRNAVNSIANSYYTRTLGTAQGKQAHSITASGNATLVHAGVATEYSVSGITAYKSGDDFTSGILYDNVLYAGSGDAVSLTLANTRDDEPLGYRYTYAFSGGTADEYEYSADYGETSYHLTMPDQDVTVNVDTETLRSTGQAVPVSYINADGQPASHDAIALDGTETTLGQNNQETWYYVGADISYGAEIDCYGNVNIILADGKTMTVSSGSYGIYGDDGSLTIYGQTLGTGTLNATATATNGIGIYTDGIVTINGGTVNATGTNDVGIRSVDGITINGGTVTTTGIMADGDVTINGGKFTATDDPGISSNDGTVTLGWTSADNFIKADSYSGVTVKIADGQSLHNGSEVLSGIITDMNKLEAETLIGVDVLQDAATNDITALATRLGGKQTNVVLQDRKLYKDGAWNTLCLPFDLGDTDASKDHWFDGTPLEGATVMTLANSPSSGTGFDTTTGTLTLYFIDADRIEAGVPYIVKWPATTPNYVENPVFTGVTVENGLHDVTFTGGSFKGTYDWQEYTTENQSILFLGAGNTLYWPQPSGGNNPSIGACRAYFQLSPNANVREFVLNFDGNSEDTGIISISKESRSQGVADAWYSLDGVKLDGKPTRKGLYIHGGRKVVVK